MSPGELRSQAQMSQANAQQHGQAAAASSGSSSSSAAAALPTLQQADVKRVVEALWEHLYSVSMQEDFEILFCQCMAGLACSCHLV